MIRRAALFAALLLPGAALAAERTVTIGGVERLRVQGPYRVTVRTGGPAGLTLGGERAAIDAVDVRSDGGVLAIRPAGALTGTRPDGSRRVEPVAIVLSTPSLRAALVIGSATVAIGPMKGETIDLSVSGTGTLSVAAVDTPRLVATLIGNGGITLAAGRAGSARLVNNGGGTVEAGAVEVGDLSALQDGAGSIRAAARFTAQVANTGLGSVAVAGAPRCSVRSPAGGAVTCGIAAR